MYKKPNWPFKITNFKVPSMYLSMFKFELILSTKFEIILSMSLLYLHFLPNNLHRNYDFDYSSHQYNTAKIPNKISHSVKNPMSWIDQNAPHLKQVFFFFFNLIPISSIL